MRHVSNGASHCFSSLVRRLLWPLEHYVQMRRHNRTGRQLFLAYLCCAWVAILMAAPLVSALEPASAGASRPPIEPFAEADANRDGVVSAAEAARVSGLSAYFALADENGDEKLDRAEYRRALVLRSGRF